MLPLQRPYKNLVTPIFIQWLSESEIVNIASMEVKSDLETSKGLLPLISDILLHHWLCHYHYIWFIIIIIVIIIVIIIIITISSLLCCLFPNSLVALREEGSCGRVAPLHNWWHIVLYTVPPYTLCAIHWAEPYTTDDTAPHSPGNFSPWKICGLQNLNLLRIFTKEYFVLCDEMSFANNLMWFFQTRLVKFKLFNFSSKPFVCGSSKKQIWSS